MTAYVSMHLGFVATAEAVLKGFRHDRPEKWHMKDRFDPDTGEKLDPVKVVDAEASSGWLIGGKFFDDVDDALDAVGKVIGCQCVRQAGDGCFEPCSADERDDVDVIDVILCVDVRYGKDDRDMIDVSVGSSISTKAILAAGPALEALGGRLKKMKIKASGPKVVMSAVAG